jgi:hypothetical protein
MIVPCCIQPPKAIQITDQSSFRLMIVHPRSVFSFHSLRQLLTQWCTNPDSHTFSLAYHPLVFQTQVQSYPHVPCQTMPIISIAPALDNISGGFTLPRSLALEEQRYDSQMNSVCSGSVSVAVAKPSDRYIGWCRWLSFFFQCVKWNLCNEQKPPCAWDSSNLAESLSGTEH